MAYASVPGVAADPISDKRAQAQQVAAQLDRLNTRAEQLNERFNAARYEADQVQQEVATANAAVARAGQQLATQQDHLRDLAVGAYASGNAGQAATAPSSADDLAVSRFYVSAVNSHQHDAIDSLAQAKADLTAKQADLRDAQAKAKAAVAAVEQDRRAVTDAVAKQQAALSQVNGELADLVAQEQARQAAEEAARVQAELQRQQELAASRARALADQQAADAARAAAAAQAAAAQRQIPTNGPPSASPAPRPAATPSPRVTPAPPPGDASAPPAGKGADAAIAEARRQLGKPYGWGDAGPGSFDCSGLTMWAWRAGGVSLPHYTKAQYDATTHVSLSDLQPGDLVFFGSDFHHEGIYVGGGQMIEAPHTGANVRYASIYRSDLYAASRPNP